MVGTQTLAMRNTKIIRQFFSNWTSGNTRRLQEMFSSDAQWICPGNPEDIRMAGVYSGSREIMAFYKRLNDIIYLTTFSAEQVLSDDDQVVSVGRIAGRIRITEESFDSTLVMHFRLFDGLIDGVEMIFDTAAVSLAFSGS